MPIMKETKYSEVQPHFDRGGEMDYIHEPKQLLSSEQWRSETEDCKMQRKMRD